MVGANLEGLVAAHHQSSLSILLVLEQADVTSATLLPLAGLADKLEELGAHLEHLLFGLLVGLGVNGLGQLHDRLEVNIIGFGSLVLSAKTISVYTSSHNIDDVSGGQATAMHRRWE